MKSGKGLIAGIEIEAGKAVTPTDVTTYEGRAQSEIEGVLGKSWPTTDVPVAIAEIAEQLTAARIIRQAKRPDPRGIKEAKDLEETAHKRLMRIRAHKEGIKLSDGSWDPDFLGRNKDEGRSSNVRVIC